MEPIAPTHIRYIKLGRGGAWAKACLDEGQLQFGYRLVPHDLGLSGDWNAVGERLIQLSGGSSKTNAVREICEFYTFGSDCLWVTFANGYLWWGFADPEVIWTGESEDGSRGPRMRRMIGGWRKDSIYGEPLRMDQLSSKLTQVAAYRRTICSVKEEDYLLRRINGIEEPVVTRAGEARCAMRSVAAEMIAGLHWAEFEILVDLIFSRSGWQRVSRVGGDQAHVDLVLEQPTTGERAGVQVKSTARQDALDRFLDKCRRSYDRLYFICHSPQTELAANGGPKLHIWAGVSLADAAVEVGLIDWLIERSR